MKKLLYFSVLYNLEKFDTYHTPFMIKKLYWVNKKGLYNKIIFWTSKLLFLKFMILEETLRLFNRLIEQLF